MNAWSASEFEARLRSIGEERYHHLHPFNERMHTGLLSEEEFRGWVRNRFYYQMNLPKKDAFILTKLPGREDRRGGFSASSITTAGRVTRVVSRSGFVSVKLSA